MYHVLGAELYFGGAQKSMWVKEGEVETGLSLKLGFSGRQTSASEEERRKETLNSEGAGVGGENGSMTCQRLWAGPPRVPRFEGYKGPKQRIRRV